MSSASAQGLPQPAATRVSAALGMLAWPAATLKTGALGVLPRSARRAQRAAPIPRVVEPRPAMPALAESLAGSDQIVEAKAEALASNPVARHWETPYLREFLEAWPTGDDSEAGKSCGELRSRSIDHLFGSVDDDPLWTRLDGESAQGRAPTPPPTIRDGAVTTASKLPGLIRGILRRAAAWRADLILQLLLLTVAGVVVGVNLLHWPGTQFDEGTYVSYAWAVQHGRLANYTYSYGHPPLAWLLIFFWTEAGGVFGHAVFSIDHSREFMLLVCLASCSLLYVLARRLGMSRVASAAAVILFALCPLSIFFHRAVLLDNPSMAFAIAAFVLAWTPGRRLWAFAGSGVCFALSMLCKETTFVLLPALVVAVAQNADRRTRGYCLTLFMSFFLLTAGFYPLYATLKGELLPGPGHVSLAGYFILQLFGRQGTGSLFNPHSGTHLFVTGWLQLDPWLLGAALAFSPITLARRTTRAVTLAFLIQVAIIFRPGYLPEMYVIGMLPFAALLVPASIEALWRWAQFTRFPAAIWTVRAALIGLTCAAALVVAPRWANGDRVAMTVRLDGSESAAQQWVVRHIGHDQRMIVSDDFWIYLIEHGFNDQPMRGGFFSKTVVSYWPDNYDPAVKREFPRGWRDFNYIVSTRGMLNDLRQNPTVAGALHHSRVVASFGNGPDLIEIRAITGAPGSVTPLGRAARGNRTKSKK